MRSTADRFAYYTQDGRREHVRVLSFVEALRLTAAGQRIVFRKTTQKAKAAKAVPLKKCHDGVWRMLAEAPKFQSGGFRFTSGGFEFVVPPNRKTKP